MHFQLTPRLMTSKVQIFGECHGILQLWEATNAKRMKIDPYCLRHHCNPLNVLLNISLRVS